MILAAAVGLLIRWLLDRCIRCLLGWNARLKASLRFENNTTVRNYRLMSPFNGNALFFLLMQYDRPLFIAFKKVIGPVKNRLPRLVVLFPPNRKEDGRFVVFRCL